MVKNGDVVFGSLVGAGSRLAALPRSTALTRTLAILRGANFHYMPILSGAKAVFHNGVCGVRVCQRGSQRNSVSLPIADLLGGSAGFVSVGTTFFGIFFAVHSLPCVTILSRSGRFCNVLARDHILHVLTRT